MRSTFPVRPQGTHTWIKATFLPAHMAIIMRSGDHVYIWAHPTSPFAGNQKHIHHLVSVGRKLDDGETSVEMARSGLLNGVKPSHLRCLRRYLERGIDPREIPVMILAYGFLADKSGSVVQDEIDSLRDSLYRLLPVA